MVDLKGPQDVQNVFGIFRSDNVNIFLGGTKQSRSEDFKWFDQSLVDQYHNWARNQPDNSYTQFCLRMDYDDNSRWRDIECDDSSVKAVVCQLNDPGTENC